MKLSIAVIIGWVICLAMLVTNCGSGSNESSPSSPVETSCGNLDSMAAHDFDMSEVEKQAWHKSNLYDSVTDSYYLPPELFLTTEWNGDKTIETPEVDYFTGYDFCVRVMGPEPWQHPYTGEAMSVYRRINGAYADYYRVGDQGVELMYASGQAVYYSGANQVPCGSDWQINAPRSSNFSSWFEGVEFEHTQTITIEEILFDSDGVLAWVVYRTSVDGVPVAEYMLEPKRGITRTYVYDDMADGGAGEAYDCADNAEMAEHSYALSDPEIDAWAKANIYDSDDDSYYIPAQLWTGGVWDGDKTLAPHPADLYFGSDFCKRIIGVTTWTHPFSEDDYRIYTRTNRGKVQLFTINARGLGRVYDSRRNGRHYENEVKFPAGSGWKIDQKVSLPFRQWSNNKIKESYRQAEITRMLFDENDVLAAMTYRWYVEEELDHEYTYMPRRGMAYTHKFSER